MSTHNICFYGEMWKISPKLSSNIYWQPTYFSKQGLLQEWNSPLGINGLNKFLDKGQLLRKTNMTCDQKWHNLNAENRQLNMNKTTSHKYCTYHTAYVLYPKLFK